MDCDGGSEIMSRVRLLRLRTNYVYQLHKCEELLVKIGIGLRWILPGLTTGSEMMSRVRWLLIMTVHKLRQKKRDELFV